MTTRSKEREQFLADVLTTAVEGGIGYWARIYDSKRSDDLDWLEITIIDHLAAVDDEVLNLDLSFNYNDLDEAWDRYNGLGCQPLEKHVHVVNLDTVASAIQRIVEPGSDINLADNIVADICGGNRNNDAGFGGFDSITADAIVQVAALGEVRYG